MLKVVDGWDETIRTVNSLIPPEIIIDWKLLWRDPIRKWVSNKSRIVLIGDAAHPHLPTSGSGATQAIEDGATIGALLDKLGKDQVPLAFRAFEKLRLVEAGSLKEDTTC
jgi:2-polyprenyl-6-methoxyphenol hydroxylase-like FAD-dependent oxidoreductase